MYVCTFDLMSMRITVLFFFVFSAVERCDSGVTPSLTGGTYVYRHSHTHTHTRTHTHTYRLLQKHLGLSVSSAVTTKSPDSTPSNTTPSATSNGGNEFGALHGEYL